jgi:hypothetical protein
MPLIRNDAIEGRSKERGVDVVDCPLGAFARRPAAFVWLSSPPMNTSKTTSWL